MIKVENDKKFLPWPFPRRNLDLFKLTLSHKRRIEETSFYHESREKVLSDN